MTTGKTTNIKSLLRDECLPALNQSAAYFSMADVRAWLQQRGLACPLPVLRDYLSQFMRSRLIHDAGRGWYSRIASPCVLNAKPMARLARQVEQAFPLLDFACWSTEQVRSFGQLLLARFVAFIHTERDAMASVADRLRDAGYDIYLNPRGAAAREFAIRERTVVIRPRPTTQPRDGHLVTIEGLLVDLFIERRTLHLMDEGEYFRMFANLAGRGTGLRAGTPSGQAAPHTTYQSGVFAKLRFGQFIPGTGSAGARQRLPTIGLFTIQ
jgi:hypothetical protein